MANIFVAYSSLDKDIIESIIENIILEADHTIWHYQQAKNHHLPKDKVIEKIAQMDIFVLFVSNNSLNSPYVQEEISAAIKFKKGSQLKEICPIIIDESINFLTDKRIPDLIKTKYFIVNDINNAVHTLEHFLRKYNLNERVTHGQEREE